MGLAGDVAVSRILLKSLSEKKNPDTMTRLNRSELEAYIRTINPADYAKRRNYIGGSTRLSEYITRGAISLPRVRELILENSTPQAAFKLINELSWREYWQLVWQVRGDEIFEYIRPLVTPVRRGIPLSVLSAETGIQALDDGIKQLQQTGYIDNHMRMWIAGLVCNVARCDWKTGADWMHSHLIDGDYASNHLSWQWIAGSYTGKPYLPQQENINTYTNTVQQNTYLDKPYSVIAEMPVPAELSAVTTTLPNFKSSLPDSTITINELAEKSEILLYSPWTLDSRWRPQSTATRVLLIDRDIFGSNRFSQNVIDSISWFAQEIPGLKIICDTPSVLSSLSADIFRKQYAGIASWPGHVDPVEALYPHVTPKFYPSFSAFWKQTQK